jgi:hypothetical protein
MVIIWWYTRWFNIIFLIVQCFELVCFCIELIKPSSVPPNYNHRLTHSKIKLMSININGIRGKKKLELSSFLEIEDPDIIAIQETKIDRNILTSELFPDNFN